MPKGFKVTGSPGSWIRRVGPYVRTHRRHFLQQSDYTVCAEFKNAGDQSGEWYFAKHEGVFQRNAPYQDILWKFNIPWTERLKVLRLLDEYNLNAFSLFESEESLMETLAVRELSFLDTVPFRPLRDYHSGTGTEGDRPPLSDEETYTNTKVGIHRLQAMLELKYCPYGPLVEQFPLLLEEVDREEIRDVYNRALAGLAAANSRLRGKYGELQVV